VEGDPVNYHDPGGLFIKVPDFAPSLNALPDMWDVFGGGGLWDRLPTYTLVPALWPWEIGGDSGRVERIPGDQRTRDLLSDPNCAKAVRAKSPKDAVTAYDEVHFSYSDLGPVRIGADGSYEMPALAEQAGKNIRINSQIDWKDPNATVAVTVTGKTATAYVLAAVKDALGATSFSAADYQSMVILHEMAHYFGAPQERRGDWNFTRSILLDCLPGLFK
jgi:hypothetical protein